ncbi:hypothetical protein REPUB_Repub03eG0069300 [Reevesia pubescens]
MQAIDKRNNCVIDGRPLFVKRASIAWPERTHRGYKNGPEFDKTRRRNCKVLVGDVTQEGEREEAIKVVIDRRCYRDALVGVSVQEDKVEKKTKTVNKNVKLEEDEGGPATRQRKIIFYDIQLPHKDMEWLDRCATGRLKDMVRLSIVKKMLLEKGVPCDVCPMGGVTVLLKFGDKN